MKHSYSIIVFACIKWGYSAADLAGVSRLKYTPAIKIIKVRCTGRIDIKHIFYSIRAGADGVMIVGWRPNECQFKKGNFTAERHVELANRILEKRGLGGQRINQYWLSGAEADKLVKSVVDTYEKVAKIGLNPLKKAKELTTPIGWSL